MSDIRAFRAKYKDLVEERERQYSEKATGVVGRAWTAIDEAGLRPLRAALGDSAEKFTEEDVRFSRPSVLGMNPSNPTQPPEDVVLPAETVNAGFDMMFAPTNLVGSGLFANGVRTARNIAGANSLRGNTVGAAKNFIPNNYGPSGTARPTVVDELMVGRVPGVQDAQQAANAREKVGSFVRWAGDSVARGVQQTISPSARALYREQGINRTMQETAKTALETGASRDTAKAVAQNQASGMLIPNQAGRVGPKAPAVKNLEDRSFLTEPVPAESGAYKGLVKDNKLKGKREKGGNVGIADKDLEIVDEHIGKVWKDRNGVPLNESDGAHIRIKNAGAGDQITGAHHADFVAKSGVHRTFSKLFKDGKNHSLEEMHGILDNLDKGNLRLHPKSKTMEDVEKNGLWVTGSFSGTAITEGGVNFIAKISPNGRVMAVVSDEHNFLEKIPVVGKVLEEALPNRSVSATPPMHFDLKKNKEKIKSVQPENKTNVKESLFDIATAKPSANLVRAEQQVNAGAAMTATGLLTGGSKNED
jgi:hypothetical protein